MPRLRLPHKSQVRLIAVGWVPVIGVAAVIFVLSAEPSLRFSEDNSVDLVVRKLGHAGIFGILALLIWRALAITTALARSWAWALVLTALYAASDEFYQGFTVGRHPALTDVGIDTLGAIAFLAVAWIGLRFAGRNRA